MTQTNKPLGITEVVLRDAHQSILATRLRIEDMLPICEKLDQIGYWSIESWGGATFDSCIRYLGEDPWERLRSLKAAMPNTPQQMLFRGQNILGYRHYADDVVDKFVERCAINGIDVFRIFDAMNDMRNIEHAVKAVLNTDAHAQGTISYTISPVHTTAKWVEQGKVIEDMGAHSICIKDMAGLLTPYDAFELVSQLKASVDIPVHLHCHATTGLSVGTLIKAIEAGVDNVDTAISSLSMTYGHSPTESIVASMAGQPRDTGLDLEKLEEVAAYFREVRLKYAEHEGSLKGVDGRILLAQVPGGMLTNMESQLKEQGAADKFDEVLKEIPRVREDLGFLPLVTPTSQIVGTQSVLNVMTGERYKSISKETAGVLKGEYGLTPAPVNAELQARVLEGADVITCRPADLIEPEMANLTAELEAKAKAEGVTLADNIEEDVLISALFAQVGWKFIANRGNPDVFEPAPNPEAFAATKAAKSASSVESYTVNVDGKNFNVAVGPGGANLAISDAPQVTSDAVASSGAGVDSPLAGNILKINVSVGSAVAEGDVVLIMEAMKMETEVRARVAGTVSSVNVKEGDAVAVGDILVSL
ncbi:sodium-extruding oxaloacetate decarboxylase subunit alpha [methanotrophic endosymbiont of Bathymodiolus puteoserpentis (Logatchev)]|jgi:oxaloacetate decarboxylase alpha subunit|uniref:sodium-extruding oxaloacetate decarboxylase subunit alpha n=1 Tax=methanotrophic endosymbiont of Bathymodiolus puteoserpentis (Logatchev) TaxID=343235 RepID=UPI00086BDD68|nr:sodium-extruding oxaloacetate decarboxylase subunit alpha [methanotrophic endosymbiont of Bathymodiolus puteoserpentis (Logatchev)]SCN47836.1 Oxaloacetate decarboxylase alpha chain [methanotrophic endosymbiont of Bathymodiolus azoricus (Menez Gwen)]SHE23427.1 Oxaloacetate decarboxylase alpha chain [methanotrophic endosymbiont of Bathymodiolus puteoserpentis (Logatchev)]